MDEKYGNNADPSSDNIVTPNNDQIQPKITHYPMIKPVIAPNDTTKPKKVKLEKTCKIRVK